MKVFFGMAAIVAAFMTRAYEGESFDLLNSVLSGGMFGLGVALLFRARRSPCPAPDTGRESGG